MLLNLILIGLVFTVTMKKKLPPVAVGLAFGGAKLLFTLFTGQVANAFINGPVFGLLGGCLVALLDRLDAKPKAAINPDRLYKTSSVEQRPFQWEYVPLAGIVLFMIGGDWFVPYLFSASP
ncbi:MAG TPA: hypothetical protein VK178_17085 [Opitutaceae bacterium]|nr:hypothetical protein [Opitutaceae bacterium]